MFKWLRFHWTFDSTAPHHNQCCIGIERSKYWGARKRQEEREKERKTIVPIQPINLFKWWFERTKTAPQFNACQLFLAKSFDQFATKMRRKFQKTYHNCSKQTFIKWNNQIFGSNTKCCKLSYRFSLATRWMQNYSVAVVSYVWVVFQVWLEYEWSGREANK